MTSSSQLTKTQSRWISEYRDLKIKGQISIELFSWMFDILHQRLLSLGTNSSWLPVRMVLQMQNVVLDTIPETVGDNDGPEVRLQNNN